MKVFALLKLSAINYNTANHSPVFKQDVYNVEVTLQELMAGGNGYMVAANILATDADADAVTYSIFTAENDPFGLLSSSSSTIIYTGQSVSTGTYSYYITAEDTNGASAYAQVNIHVIDSQNDPRTENTPPEILLDDLDGIYEPDTDGYVTITGHLDDATNYRTMYGSTYELKLYDANDVELEPIEYTINEELTFTMSIDMRGYEVGDVELKLKAIEKIMNLDPAESQVAQLTVNVAVEKPVVGIIFKAVGIEGGPQNIEITFVTFKPVIADLTVKFTATWLGGDSGATAQDFAQNADLEKLLNGEIVILSGRKESEILILNAIVDNDILPETFSVSLNKNSNYYLCEPGQIYDSQNAIEVHPALKPLVFGGLQLYVQGNGDNHKVHINDITQGFIADCWIWAGMMAAVRKDPNIVENLITEDDNVYLVSLFLPTRVGNAYGWSTVAVPKDIFRAPNGGLPLGDVDPTTGNVEVWPLVLEYAAAIASDNLGLGGWGFIAQDNKGSNMFRAMTGRMNVEEKLVFQAHKINNITIYPAYNDIKQAIDAGKQVLIYSKEIVPDNNYSISNNHTYIVIGYNNDNIILDNPHGAFSNGDHTVPKDKLHALFSSYEIIW